MTHYLSVSILAFGTLLGSLSAQDEVNVGYGLDPLTALVTKSRAEAIGEKMRESPRQTHMKNEHLCFPGQDSAWTHEGNRYKVCFLSSPVNMTENVPECLEVEWTSLHRTYPDHLLRLTWMYINEPGQVGLKGGVMVDRVDGPGRDPEQYDFDTSVRVALETLRTLEEIFLIK